MRFKTCLFVLVVGLVGLVPATALGQITTIPGGNGQPDLSQAQPMPPLPKILQPPATACPKDQIDANKDMQFAMHNGWTIKWINQYQLDQFRTMAKDHIRKPIPKADTAYFAISSDREEAYLNLVVAGCVVHYVHVPGEVAEQIIGSAS